ncbi:hypothetical protein DICPUDRAFT_55360 [Dictyostelium purpureum]|uniref:WDR59/RTC1-like RING zinc finger domain-containing protein n=1 Tax=Dictyostelium purpureum TaxID=5786 RepID=F0ZLR7_DICPU|nr:uncharacterized protein DICPUDRAFT_55360 [Dictyostelium purpureum]EGC35117.1 hypothetical protein DICPUDRAFT_55360 [Dictyostelium purpureum]|eukprot:XP_003288369.1 hypothetical protein DICPUDRAFT_55360 [Dictyostelium purpureum]
MNQPPNKCQVYLNLGSPLSAISASYDQNRLIVAGRDIVKIVSLQNNEFKITSNLRAGKTQSLNYTGNDCCWHPSNSENHKSLIATAATNGAVVIWNLVRDGSKSVERVFSDHSRAVNKLAWHPDKLDCLLTGSQDNTLRFWDIRDSANASKITFSPKSESIRDVQFNPFQSNQFAAAFDNGTVQLWDIRKPTTPAEKITSHQGLVLTIDWHPEEKNIIASGGRDRAIRVWDFSTGRSLNSVSTISSVSRIKWRPANKWHIASCSSIVDFNIHVWDVKKPYIPLFSFTDHRDVPTGLIWRSSSTLISCSKDSNLLLNEYNDAYKPYKHIRTTGISWNINNEIASINDKINRNQNPDNALLQQHQQHQQQQQSYQAPMHASFFASFNVPTPPPLPPLVKVEQGVMNVFTPKYPNIDNINDERYVFEYYAKNYKFRGDSFNNLCQHNQLVSLNVKQYHISKVWSLLQLYFSHLDQLKPKDERETEEQILQQQQQLQLQKDQKEKSKEEKQQKDQNKQDENQKQQPDKEIQQEKEKENHQEENSKEIEKIKNIETIKNNNSNNKELSTKSNEDDDKKENLDSIKFDGFGQLNGGDVFDPSNDMMTAKEPSLDFADSGNDLFNNLLSAEAVTPLVSLPIRAPSLDNQKSTENNLDKSKDNNKRQKDDKADNNKKDKDDKNNNDKSKENNDSDKNSTDNNHKDNNTLGKSNNSNNDNNNKEKDNSKEKQDKKNNSEDLKILIPCFEFEEFDFQPILIDMLDCCIERGDVQTCVFIVLILNRYIDLNIDKNQLTRWFGSYIDLLQRFKFWSLSLEVMKYCDDQTINQASKRHTTYISACSHCGKSIPQNSLICEKCNRIASKCSICRLPVKGVFVWCQGCGHGGHLDHMKSWFIDNKQKSCPTGCTHICTPLFK